MKIYKLQAENLRNVQEKNAYYVLHLPNYMLHFLNWDQIMHDIKYPEVLNGKRIIEILNCFP